MSGSDRVESIGTWVLVLLGLLTSCSNAPGYFQELAGLPPRVDVIDEAPALAEPFDMDEVGTVGPADDADVLERLERAELSISKLQSQAESAVGSQGMREPGAATATTIKSLEGKFEELQKRLTKKNYPTVEMHGVFQADIGWFGQDEASPRTVGNLQDGADFRRARLSANGSLIETMNFFLQFEFAFPGRPTFTDLWWEATQVPVLGNIRVGQ